MTLPTWDLRQLLLDKIARRGGWVNTHSHLDRSYIINRYTLPRAMATLQEKWSLADGFKQRSSVTTIYDHMAYALERQRQQGVTALGTFIDVDAIVKDKSIRAAQRLREHNPDFPLRFINQTLKGVLEPEAQRWFLLGAEFVDIIGGLPGKDKGHEAEHLDVVLDTARRLHKMAHVHVDQNNTPLEKETELLISKTQEYHQTDRVVAIHSVSLAAHPQSYRRSIYRRLKKAGVAVITCPTAWIDSRRSEAVMVRHNAIAPVEELIAAGVVVALGTDNIADYYKPFTDGDMWTELRFLLESCHYYDLDQLVNIATTNGRQVLGLKGKK
jgi:cytosine/creatinine deaminase